MAYKKKMANHGGTAFKKLIASPDKYGESKVVKDDVVKHISPKVEKKWK